MKVAEKKPTVATFARLAQLDEGQAAHILKSDALFFTAYDGKKLAGVLWGIGDGVVWLLVGIYVAPPYQRQGIGNALRQVWITHVEASTKGHGRIYGFIPARGKPFWDNPAIKPPEPELGRYETRYRKITGSA